MGGILPKKIWEAVYMGSACQDKKIREAVYMGGAFPR